MKKLLTLLSLTGLIGIISFLSGIQIEYRYQLSTPSLHSGGIPHRSGIRSNHTDKGIHEE